MENSKLKHHYRLANLCNLRYLLTPLFLFLFLLCSHVTLYAQADFSGKQPRTINFSSFGAVGDGVTDNSYALIKMTRYIENRWRANGDTIATGDTLNINYNTHYLRIEIPSGTYIIGRQIDILQTPYDTLYPYKNTNAGAKRILYSTLYGGGNNKEGVDIVPMYNSCISKWITKRYYDPSHEYCLVHGDYYPVNGLEIIGTGASRPVIKYADSLRLGFMDINGNPINYPAGGVCGFYWEMYHAAYTKLFYFNYCKNIKMQNLEIDGNNKKIFYMGGGIDMYQGGPVAFYMNVKQATLKNIYTHNLGIDGIIIADGDCSTMTKFVADSIVSDSNRRQALTWSCADSIYFSNSRFSNSGKSLSIVQNGAPVLSSPASGLDIEYEGQCAVNVQYPIRNGVFENCKFLNNDYTAVVNDAPNGSDSVIRAKNVLFKKCTFHDVDGYGVWVMGRNFHFDSCNIYAPVVHGYRGDSANSAPKFTSCLFEDQPYNGIHLPYIYKLVDYTAVKNALFQNCRFKINDSARDFFWINWDDNISKQDRVTMDNCEYIYNNKGIPYPIASRIRHTNFKGRNTVQNVLNSIHSYHMIVTRDCALLGSNDPCNPNTLSFEGQVEHVPTTNTYAVTDTFSIGGTGYAHYYIDDKALLVLDGTTDINIGKNSGMHINKGGSVNGRSEYETFITDGLFTAHDGGYIYLPYGKFVMSANAGDTLMYIDKGVNKYGATVSPYWNNGIGYGTGIYQPQNDAGWLASYNDTTAPCIQGGHVALANYVCSPVYKNILCGKSKSILYNKSVGCFGNGNANNYFEFIVKGGTPAYSYVFDGTATNNTSFANLSIGNHTLIVNDANTCKDTFIVNIDTAFEYKIIKGCVNGAVPAKIKTNACTNPTVTGPVAANFIGNGEIELGASGTYTLTATSPTGSVTKSVYIGNCSNCTTAPDTAEWYPPNMASSSISPDATLIPKCVVLQGTIPVDNEWYIYNNNQIYLTQNTLLEVQNNQALIINKSKLQGCTDFWKGIKADGYDKRVIINNQSTLQDMMNGVWIKNNAFLQARNSTYKNNGIAIRFENIKQPAYKSSLTNNTFTSDTSIFGVSCNGFAGIYAINSTDIEIGDSTGKGNTFDNLRSGICVTADADIINVVNSNTSRIGIYNNQFRNINNCDITGNYIGAQKINGGYNFFNGAGVNAYFGLLPSTFDARIDIRNQYDTNTVIRFENCDRAVMTTNAAVTAKNLYMNQNLMGIMCNALTGKKVEIENNYIKNAVIGMQFIGNNTNSYVRNNTLEDMSGVATGLYTNYWGAGIDVEHFSNADTSTLDIKDNDISISSFAGRGINLNNTGKNIMIQKNDIDLKWESGEVICVDASLLNGISATNINNSVLYKNIVTGTDSINNLQREDIAGILINNSIKPRVECNIADRTRFGISAISECLTDTNGIKGNTVHEQVLGWVFRHLGNEGTFGNVGTLQYDNHNLWTGNTQQYKVYKFCMGSLPDKIYTHPNFLILGESNSYNLYDQTNNNCAYDVAQNQIPYVTYDCPANFNFQQPFNVTSAGLFPHSEAIAIATHTKTYTEYPEIAYWMDARKLYKDLDNSSTYRNSNDTLLAFYDSLNTEVIHHLEETETNIANLIAAMSSQNYELYQQRLAEASSTNSNIPNSETQNENERTVNDIYIKMLAYGVDTLDSEDSTTLAELSALCPYIGGTAVYKARALYAMYAPANMYDDIALCNQVGVYKQDESNNEETKGIFDNENNYLQSLKPKANVLAKFAETKFMLYPNPASTNITIAYQLTQNEKGNVIIYDMLGREQMKIDLSNSNNKVSINVSLLRQGIYTYKYLVNNRQRTSGKLLIE